MNWKGKWYLFVFLAIFIVLLSVVNAQMEVKREPVECNPTDEEIRKVSQTEECLFKCIDGKFKSSICCNPEEKILDADNERCLDTNQEDNRNQIFIFLIIIAIALFFISGYQARKMYGKK